MRRHTRNAFACLLAIALMATAGTAAYALASNPYYSTISFVSDELPMFNYSNELVATVTRNADSSYHYEYVLSYFSSSTGDPLTDFSVGNEQNVPFWNMGTDNLSFSVCPNTDSVYWNAGSVPLNTTVKFWYDSYNSYTTVNCTVAGGIGSMGTTLGMLAPEPSAVWVLAIGLGSIIPMIRRKR